MSYLKVKKSEQVHIFQNALLKLIRLSVCYLIIVNNCTRAEQHPAEEDGPLSEVQTAVNLEVALPCDLTPGSMIADKVQLVIWYKQGSVKPIYTFDARGRQLQQAIPWADEFVLKNKAQFLYDTNPPSLRIKNVQTSDAGLYKCRVDFHKSPTRNWRINVTVLVPPTKLTILDTYGAAIRNSIAGPYIEGDNINLTCLSSGGVPPPKVSWWREHALADDSYQILPDGTVRNVLHLYNISRADLLSVYTCQASNGHIVAALSGKVRLEMKLPPLNLLLQGLNHPLVAGVSTHVTCTSIGARPPPDIVWKKGGITIRGATQSTSTDGNSTLSELVLIPAPEDNEKEVACLVARTLQHQQDISSRSTSVPFFNDNSFAGIELFLKDSRILNVTHAPIVTLNLGAPLDANNLMSGSDLYLECGIIANPGIIRIEWYHNDKKLHSSRGILISNQTLVLQSISKVSHGKYFCLATNIQGSVSSNEVYLDVKYPPICKSESTVIRAAIKQIINITCLVDSNPINNLKYKWQFNNSLDNLIELPLSPNHFFQTPSSLPLKSMISPSGHHHNHYNYYQEYQKHPHHHKRLLQKIILQKQHQQSSIVPIDLHGRIHLSSSVLAPSLQSPLYTSNAKESINMNGHLSYATVPNENGSKINNNFLNVNHNDYNLIRNQARHDSNVQEESHGYPLAQMLYSNMVYTNQLDKTQRTYNENVKRIKIENDGRKIGSSLYGRNGDIRASETLPLHNVYQYNIESYESFGAVSCVASNQMGQSQPCWYHIQPADLPDPVKNCTTNNATSSSVQVQCTPGYDGGIQQHFHVQVFDELNRQILYNATYKHSDFKIKSLPSDSVFVLRITSINLQGSSKLVYRLRARTLSVPLLRTASSTAVLVQLTPLLGALMGLIATLILVVICIAIFIKFRKKHIYRSNGNATETADKGSVELLSRNLGSRSSLEDKNPDVVPLENSEDEFHAEEEAFDRLNMDSYRVLCTQPKRRNLTSSPPPLLASLSPKQKCEISLTTNPSYNVCNTPQQIRKPIYTAPPPLLSSKTPSNIYTRVPGRTYSPAFETRTPPTSPYGSLTICTMPLLGQNQPSHLQSLQVQHHQLHHQNPQQHPMTNDNVMFCNYNMSP